MALVPDLEPQKRKRGPDDTDTQPPLGHQQQAMSFSQGELIQEKDFAYWPQTGIHVLTLIGGNPGGINYLSSLLPERLGLIQGDTETFSDIINLISEYEGDDFLMMIVNSLLLIRICRGVGETRESCG